MSVLAHYIVDRQLICNQLMPLLMELVSWCELKRFMINLVTTV